MADFPPVGISQDSSLFSETQQDPALRNEIEGGYVTTRAKYTRTPRKTFKTGFTHITDAQKQTLQAFWDTKKGGSASFTYTHPTLATDFTVRFKGAPNYIYKGHGTSYAWDVTDVVLEQV